MLEEKIEALALALAANTAILERVVAGQQAALEKIETPKATRTPRTTKETPAAAPEPAAETGKEGAADTESGACAATTATDGPPTATNDELKAVAGPWLAASVNPEDRKEIGEFLMSIAQLFGSPKLTGPDSTLTGEQFAQALWFVKRKQAGLAVDFKADYDFTSDPTVGDAPAEEFDPLG